MIIRKSLLTILLIILCNVLTASPIEVAYNKMLNSYSRLNSWQAVINQTNYFVQTKTSLKSSGNFYFQKGKIAIRYNKPNEQRMLIQKGIVTIYDKSSNSYMKTELVSAVQSLNPAEIVKSYWQKSDNTVMSSTRESTVISIKPKKDEQIKEIKATIANKSGYITRFVYTDIQGNTVTISFTGMKVNKAIAASVWNLNIPANAKGLSN